jgi:Flp pilus assembly protein TadG
VLRRAIKIRGEGGQALVEFALALPLLVLFLFGIIFFAEALNYWNDETNAANVTARYAAVIGNAASNPTCGSSANVTDYAVCKAGATSAALNGACAQVTDLTSSSSFTSGDQVQITLKYHDSIPALGSLFGSVSLPITSTATMMMEATPSGSQLSWLTGGRSSACP